MELSTFGRDTETYIEEEAFLMSVNYLGFLNIVS
jgi:hypothetical protein